VPLQNNNLWILFEERPKNEVIKKILQIYINKNNIKFTDTSISIVPIFIENKFEFTYKIINFKIDTIDNIYLKLVSGQTSFVDFLLFKSKKEPEEDSQLSNCLYGIEETKTDSSESRNTAAGQRGTKFLILEYFNKIFKANIENIMLYNNIDSQNEVEAGSVKFIKKCLKTNGVIFYGDYSSSYKNFHNIDDLIKEKNNMRKPPAGNTPIRIEKKIDEILISGILSKPKDKGNIGHDPNQGQLITISNTLRKLGWKKKIIITQHGVKQDYINRVSGNKFMYAIKILGLELENIDTPIINLPNKYWYYEKNGEKVGTILLHTICNYLDLISIYENHAGSERGYFYSENQNEIVVNKKFSGKNINLPDYVFADKEEKIIYICEGEMFKNYNKGIKQTKGFDIFINQYILKYYPEYTVIKSIILSSGEGNKIKEMVLFQLNKNGEILLGKDCPNKIKKYLNSIVS
jgi:hypothetical protein